MLSLVQMNYIISLAENINFQRAADLCNVTQPTLSMQIKKAEETLGHLIFDRSRNPLELTPYGAQLLPILRDIISENRKIEELNQRAAGIFQEKIRIGVIPTIAVYLIPDLYRKWIEDYPNSKFEISELKTTDLISALENKKVDLGIFAGPYHHDRLSTFPLFNEEILVYTHYNGDVIEQNELNELKPWLLSSGNCLRNQMIKVCNMTDDSNQDWHYQGGNIEMLVKMVDLNGGYTLVPQNISLPSEKRHNLKHIHSQGFNSFPGRSVVAVCSQRSSKWAIMEKLIRSVQLQYGTNEKLEILSWK
jgi:LysR family hydrogen peroxide-inducible transcriptional activator